MRLVLIAPTVLLWCLCVVPASAEERDTPTDAVVLLARMGEPGHAALLSMLEVDNSQVRCQVLVVLTEHCKDLTPFLSVGANLLLTPGDPKVAKHAGWLVSRAGAKGEKVLLTKLDATRQRTRAWAVLNQAAPDLASRLLERLFTAQAPKQKHLGFDADGLRSTAIFGGRGGGAYRDCGGTDARLVGLQTTIINWSGHIIIRSVQPLYRVDGEIREGAVHGHQNRQRTRVLAKPGYAVGGLLVRTGHRVDGFAIVFMRVDQDRLDPADFYVGPWQGGHGGGGARLLGGAGLNIVGICGRRGADVDAIGLIEQLSKNKGCTKTEAARKEEAKVSEPASGGKPSATR